ncbi:metalloendopeptidase OMA1, mitochondrial-like [Mytilus trossulus]|uniref:metalloendopeptidase OMA1, mitochondrial-like n=1 Tax=Mytilus trossulus TaxID=6551 RepID=UPI0030061784
MSYLKHIHKFQIHPSTRSNTNKIINFLSERTTTKPYSVCTLKTFPAPLISGTNSLKFQPLKQGCINCFKYGFHTSSRKQAIGPHLWVVVKLAMKGASVISGRGFRQWWKTLPDHKRLHFIHLSKKQWKEILLAISGISVLGSLYYWSHIQEAPITGRRRFIAFTDNQFQRVMKIEAEQLQEQLKEKILPNNHPLYPVLLKIVQRLYDANTDIKEVEMQKWTLAIVDDPDNVNAFVLPTGDVFVYTGLIKFVETEDELAIVLGHEMAHAILKHAAESLSQAQWIDYFVILIMAALWAVIPYDGIAFVFNWFVHKVTEYMLHLPHNRLHETEADKVGLELAAKACFDVRFGTVFWRKFELKDKVDNGKLPEWLSTHPASEKRVDFFEHFIPEYLEMRKRCRCPPLSEKDPRKLLLPLQDQIDNLITSKRSRGNIERLKIAPSSRSPLVSQNQANNPSTKNQPTNQIILNDKDTTEKENILSAVSPIRSDKNDTQVTDDVIVETECEKGFSSKVVPNVLISQELDSKDKNIIGSKEEVIGH